MSFILLGILNSQAAGADIPASLNPALWLDASDASTISESGGSVSQWDNKGTLSNFVQSTSGSQPTTGVTTLNGLNVIDWVDDFLEYEGAKGDFNFLHDGTEFFVATVVEFDLTSQTRQTILDTSQGAFSSVGYILRNNNDSNNNRLDEFILRGGSPAALAINDDGFFNSGFLIYSNLIDSDNSTPADRISYFQNNTQGTATNSDSGTPSTSDPFQKLTIGAGDEQESEFLKGSLAELIIVSGADATETNRQAVVDYLNEKWAVF